MSRNQHCPFKLKESFTNKFINGFLFTLNEEQPFFFTTIADVNFFNNLNE